MILALQELTSRFRLVKLDIAIKFEKGGALPDFKGSMLHGWFGHALRGGGDNAYPILFGQHDAQHPKPYIICPSLDHKTKWQAGEIYHFELTLFGDAVAIVDKVLSAIKYGQKLGLGPERMPFKLITVSSHTPSGKRLGVVPTLLSDWITAGINPEEQSELAIEFITPMRTKYHGQIVKAPVDDLNFWCRQVIRRLVKLSEFWVCDDKVLFNAIYEQQLPIRVSASEKNGYFEDWQRYSLRQEEQLPFGGVKGQVSFYGFLGLAPVLMQIGEVLHIGSKTTFGLGKIETLG